MQASQQVLLQNPKGLHVRASAQVVRVAESFSVTEIKVCHEDVCVSAQSMMELLMLGAGMGSVLTLEAEGKEAKQAVRALVALIADQFGEKSEL